MFWLDGRMQLAHRVSYEMQFGPLAEMCVLHTCDTPLCVNPSHLTAGTQLDNIADMHAKHRRIYLRVTHCVHGHEFNEKNTHIAKKQRMCRECCRIRTAVRRIAKKESTWS